MLTGFGNTLRIPELKKKLFFTALMIAIFRLGTHIVTPGLNMDAAREFFNAGSQGWLGLVNMFSGGAFERFSIFALGIMPYISSSIIFQLLTAVIPTLKQISKEGELGKRKINQYTRYGTIALSIIQSLGLAIWLESLQGGTLVQNPGIGYRLLTIITMTSGTVFIMWLGEQINERGVGNGISIIIFAGIAASLPKGISEAVSKVFKFKDMSIFELIFLVATILFAIAVVIAIQLGHRRIPVSYAKQIRGNKMMGGQTTHLPLKIDYSGVIAVIFASSILAFPSTIINFLAGGAAGGEGTLNTILLNISDMFQDNSSWDLYTLLIKIFPDLSDMGVPLTLLRVFNTYNLIFACLVIFFCYFYTSIIFNPKEVAENLKKHGGFVPGRRPGTATAEFIYKVLMKITLIGALLVVFICIFPSFVEQMLGGNMPGTLKYLMGGTTVLILVGVALDTIQQINSLLLQRNYMGFAGKGKLRGRRG
jgi:preprotein translocase subunit SecY